MSNILSPSNPSLLDSTGPRGRGDGGRLTRFAAVDGTVYGIHKDAIHSYFESYDVELTVCILEGEEEKKR